MREFILNRSGKVSCETTSTNQCREVGWKNFEYNIKIHTSLKLDKEGFIIDHSIVHESVKQAFANAGSCEELCLSIEHHVMLALILHDVEVRKLYIKVRPEAGTAYVEYVRKFQIKFGKPVYEFEKSHKANS